MTHTTDDPNMKIITGNNRTGGLIGEFYMTNSSSLNNITVNLPIDGHDEVGGLIGKLYVSSTSSFTLSIDTYNKSTGSQGDQPIKGESKIGGLIGLSSAKRGIHNHIPYHFFWQICGGCFRPSATNKDRI